jgi:hypothetical protein
MCHISFGFLFGKNKVIERTQWPNIRVNLYKGKTLECNRKWPYLLGWFTSLLLKMQDSHDSTAKDILMVIFWKVSDLFSTHWYP